MEKTMTTIAIILGMTLGAVAQQSGYFSNDENATGGGMFGRGFVPTEEYNNRNTLMPNLPNHLMEDDQDAPLGSGTALLLGMGAVYVIAKKRKEN